VSITVVSEPASAGLYPPRNRITVAVGAGEQMQSIALYRVESGVRTLVRKQPSSGFETITAYDYEMPYGSPVTYEADIVKVGAVTNVFTETWANQSGWQFYGGPTTVSGGKLRSGSGGGTDAVRPVPQGKYRVTIGSIENTSPSGTTTVVFYNSTTNKRFGLYLPSGVPTLRLLYGSTQVTTALNPAGPLVVDFVAGKITVTGPGGVVATYPLDFVFDQVQITFNNQGAAQGTVGGIRVDSYPPTSALTDASSAATLNSVDAWLIHPANPALSFPLSGTDPWVAGIRDIGEVEQVSTSTKHEILGEAQPIISTTGPRLSDKTSLVLLLRTRAEEVAVRALVNDQTPLLIRMPEQWDIGWEDAFYSVGDVSFSRVVQGFGNPERFVTFPLQQVQSPVVDQLDAGWSWEALAAEFPTWEAVVAAFATWSDVAINNRRPGY
jgi:hypothetical protein